MPVSTGAAAQLAALRAAAAITQDLAPRLESFVSDVPPRGRVALNVGFKAAKAVPEVAVLAFRVAINVEPAYEPPHLHLARVLWVLPNRLGAIEALRDAAKHFPRSCIIHGRLGEYLIDAIIDAQQAEACFRLAIEEGSADILHRFGLAEALRRQRKISEAVAAFRIASLEAEKQIATEEASRVNRIYRRFHYLMFGEVVNFSGP